MAAVHNNNSSNSDQRNGTASPGGWHFPKSGLGTPDLFYSFSGGSSSSAAGNAHHGVGGSSSSNAPSWFKPQGASQGNNNVLAASSNHSKAPASSSSAAPAAVKSEEPDGHADDDARASAGNPSNQRADNAGKNSKDNTGNEEANRTQRALSDPPVRQSPAWVFPAAGFGPHKTHLEQEPNPFEHSFSRTDSDPSQSHSHHAFAQAVNASNAAGGAGAGPGGNAPSGIASYNNGYPSNALMNGHNGYEIGPPRRARSQSPKSAGWQHSGITASHNNFNSNAYGHADSSSFLGANLFGNSSKGAFSTPSSELPSFGWAFDNQALGGGGGPGGNGASGAAGAGHHQATSNAGNSIFDPTSIRTGLTPGGIGEVKPSSHLQAGGGASNTGAPHSPATQALFAMMTNATPGAEVGGPAAFAHSAGQHKTSGLAGPIQGLHHHQASLGNDSRASSSNNSSSNSIPQVQQQPSNDGQQGIYSQALPRPMHPQGSSQFANTQQPLHSSYHTGNPNYLQQNMPRPLPPRAFDSTQSSEASSSQSIPQLHNTRQHHQGGAANRPVDPNPLYLLSQHAQDGQQQHPPNALPPNAVQRLQPHQQQPGHLRHPSDQQAGTSSHNEDAMLAAAALSGLSTPRPAYVGGPAPTMPSVNPGNINSAPVPNLVQPPLGRTKPIPPPANLFHEQKPPSQQQQGNTKGGNKKGAAGGGNKRKKGATATPEPSGPTADDSAAASSKAKVRRTSRRTAASTNLAEPESGDEIEQKYLPGGSGMGSMSMMDDDDNNDGQNGGGGDSDDDDMMSNNGSQNGSRDGGGMGADGQVSPPRKGGRGPKQHFATEEEKRKNFLERNRQAALKCRQRKKQWLTQLQSKVEYLTADNETLQATVARLREEVASLRAVLGVHVDCQMNVPPGPGAPAGGVMTVGAYLHGVQQQQAQGHPHYQQQHPHRQHQ